MVKDSILTVLNVRTSSSVLPFNFREDDWNSLWLNNECHAHGNTLMNSQREMSERVSSICERVTAFVGTCEGISWMMRRNTCLLLFTLTLAGTISSLV